MHYATKVFNKISRHKQNDLKTTDITIFCTSANYLFFLIDLGVQPKKKRIKHLNVQSKILRTKSWLAVYK